MLNKLALKRAAEFKSLKEDWDIYLAQGAMVATIYGCFTYGKYDLGIFLSVAVILVKAWELKRRYRIEKNKCAINNLMLRSTLTLR